MSSILSVSAINSYVAFKLKNDPKLKGVAVKGEISDLNLNYSSGHIYFSLTDGKASLKAVMFASNASRLRFCPEVGMSVIAFGGIDVYERSGIYQLNCTQLLPDGIGSDSARLAKLKDELEREGVFSKPKMQIARYPGLIAVVTSPTGAAIEDIKSVVARRYPIAKIALFPAVVQGIAAPKSISEAIEAADGCGADTIILTRGGGSNEDLSCFNTKEAVMAVFRCKTPVISAVGHEIDVSLCDYAADMRAATPTAAAELATPDINAIAAEINYLKESIHKYADKKLAGFQDAALSMKQLIFAYSPLNRLSRLEKEIIGDGELIGSLAGARISGLEREVFGYLNTLSGFDPMRVISRGYALIYMGDDLVTSASGLKAGDDIRIVFRDGDVSAQITGGQNQTVVSYVKEK